MENLETWCIEVKKKENNYLYKNIQGRYWLYTIINYENDLQSVIFRRMGRK